MRFLSAVHFNPANPRPSRRGQTLVEYALVLCVLTIVLVASFQLLGNRVIVIFSAITTLLDTAQSSH